MPYDIIHTCDAGSYRQPALKTQPNTEERPKRILLIGYGLHASKSYGPHIEDHNESGRNVKLVGVVDVNDAMKGVTERIHKLKSPPPCWFVDSFEGDLTVKAEALLNHLVETLEVNAVIVSAVPEVHRAFVEWALRRGISVMVDKPYTSRRNAVSDIEQARRIAGDMHETLKVYERAIERFPNVCATMQVQRRFMPVHNFIRDSVADVAERTGCPITYIHGHHEDGQWRLPHEILGIDYHGYTGGNGKVSHSGEHILDMVQFWTSAAWCKTTRPDVTKVCARFTQPAAMLTQIPARFYNETFGPEWAGEGGFDPKIVKSVANKLGELDASIGLEFMREGEVISQADITLLHNSVSQRHWLRPKTDLYKQSGRIKAEKWQVVSGPFQSISVETRQAEDQHENNGVKCSEPGGPNHMQIIRVRNAGVLGGPKIEVFQAEDLSPDHDAERRHGEQAKMKSLEEFLDFLDGRISRDELRSDLSKHLTTARWMSAAYESHNRKTQGQDRFVTLHETSQS